MIMMTNGERTGTKQS